MFPGSLQIWTFQVSQAKCVLAVVLGVCADGECGSVERGVQRGALWVSPLGPGWLKGRIQCPQRVQGEVSGVTSLEESGLSVPTPPADFNTDNFICKEGPAADASPAHQVGAGRGQWWCWCVTRSSKRPA